MIVLFAGLPGSGKSTIAAAVAQHLQAVILNKDDVRSHLFPGPTLIYDPEQDTLTMQAIYQAAAWIQRHQPHQMILIDGRTFRRNQQIQEAYQQLAGLKIRVIECICEPAVAEERISQDMLQDQHPAKNRTPELYRHVRQSSEPLTVPRLIVDTTHQSQDHSVQITLEYLAQTSDMV